MLKYAIPLMFVAGIAFAQAPNQTTGTPQGGQPGVTQPNPAARTPGQAAAPNGTTTSGQTANAPGQTTPGQNGTNAGVAARNSAIQQIEQALQLLRQNNQ